MTHHTHKNKRAKKRESRSRGPKEETERRVTSECGDALRGVVVGGASTPGSSPGCVAAHLLTVWDFFHRRHFTISMGLLWGIVNKKCIWECRLVGEVKGVY